MKNFLFILFFSICNLCYNVCNAQYVERVPVGACTTGLYDSANYMKDAEGFLRNALLQKQMAPNSTNAFTAPYVIKCFIRIFRETNGTYPAATIAEAKQNFDEMNVQYSGHDICFQLVGIDFIDDSYGNNLTYDSLLDTDYKTYLNTKRISNTFTIFIHDIFVNSGSSGNAYDIPNSFVSIAKWATISNNVHSIFAHEVGHALGLYHTFQRQYYNNNTSKSEQVTRNTLNACYSCTNYGDLCCDTPADFSGSQSSVNGSCVYTGVQKDTCGPTTYAPSTINIMSYMPWDCISFTSAGFTADQRTRMHATINDVNGPVYSKVLLDNVNFGFGNSLSSGMVVAAAKNSVVSTNTTTYSSSCKFYGTVSNAGFITVNPGTTFTPSTNGLAILSFTTTCN